MITEKCMIGEKSYEHGAEVCGDDKCQVCIDGKWEDTDMVRKRRSGLTIAPGKDLSEL